MLFFWGNNTNSFLFLIILYINAQPINPDSHLLLRREFICLETGVYIVVCPGAR